MEMLLESAIDAARDQFIQPRQQQPGSVFAKPEHLRWFTVESLGEPLRIQTITQ